jgi:hypothetical protein
LLGKRADDAQGCDTRTDGLLEVTVSTNRADDAAGLPDHGIESIDEQARRKNIRPIASADDLVQDGVFDTDEELDAFLAHVVAMRHADLA